MTSTHQHSQEIFAALHGLPQPHLHLTLREETYSNIDQSAGVFALPKAWAAAHNLPASRDWKPDRSKGVYMVAFFHALHCVPYLRQTIQWLQEADAESLNEVQEHHVAHCLALLRSELMSTAEDTLLTSPLTQRGKDGSLPPIGVNQTSQCRNFGAVQEWSMKNSACYLTVEDHPNATSYWDNCVEDGWVV